MDVQARDGRSRNHPGYLWQYGTPSEATIFEFRMGRGREGPMRFLEHFEGILQTDAYAAYDRVGGPKMVHAACWAHSRRRFVEATQLNPQDAASARIVAQMAKLFAIDAETREENMDHAARHALRMQRAPAVLAELKSQMEAASRTALPSSPLGKAAAYNGAELLDFGPGSSLAAPVMTQTRTNFPTVERYARDLDIIAEVKYRLDALSTPQKRLLFSSV